MIEESPTKNNDVRTRAVGEVEFGGCGIYWKMMLGDLWRGKKSYMVQRFKVANDAKPDLQ